MLLALVMLALLSTPVFSASIPLKINCLINPQGLTDIGSCVSESIGISAIGLIVSLAVVALTYLLGEILNMGGLKGWYRKELWESAKSIMLVAIIYSVLALLGSLSASLAVTSLSTGSSLLSGGGASMQQCSSVSTLSAGTSTGLSANLATLYNAALIGYLQPTRCYAYNAFATVFGLSVGIRTAKTLSVETWFAIPLIIPTIPPLLIGGVQFGSTASIFTSTYIEGIDPTIPTFSFIAMIIRMLIVPVMVLLQFQADLLPTVVMSGLAVFLPIGIVLRSIPFLRGIGGTMIAIAIGTSIIYPVLLVTLNMPITDYFIGLTSNTASAPTPCSGGAIVCSLLYSIPVPTAVDPLILAIGSNNFNPLAANKAAEIGFTSLTLGLTTLYPVINLLNQYALIIVLQFVLFPIDMVLGIIFVQTLARSMGGALKLSIGKRIKIA